MATPNSEFVGVVVAHTHWDREWYATFEQYRIRLVALIDKALDLLERNPRFRYFTLDGQTIVLEDYLAIRPENESRLRALVQSGRLLIGPWYVLPDEFLVSPEALVRNLMLGRWVGAAFGPVMDVGYAPDPFGHVAQLPQILAGFGIDSFIFSRGLGDEGEELGAEFLWEAPDGTPVLAVHQLGWGERGTGYLNAASLGYASPWVPRTGGPDFALAANQLATLCANLRRYARTPYLLLNNGCDHLEPQPELPEMLDYANSRLSGAKLEQGTFPQYVGRVRAAAPALQTLRGELRRSRYAPLLSGVFSARVYLKQENARAQTLLERWAEPFSAVAWLEGGDYPAAFLWHAWRHLLANHPHDSICGCSVDQVHAEMLPRFARAQQVGEHFADEALQRLFGAADSSRLPADVLPLAVFNPLGWMRTEVMAAPIDLPSDWPSATAFAIITPDGRCRPCQVLERRRYQPFQGSANPEVEQVQVAFLAQDLPALGYRIYGLAPAAAHDPGSMPRDKSRGTAAPFSIENEYYAIFARPDGTLDITHKPTEHTLSGALSLADEADAGDEYTFGAVAGDIPLTSREAVASVRLAQGGPVVATLEIALDWQLPAALAPDRRARDSRLVPCPVRMLVSLAGGVDRIDLDLTVANAAADHRLRLLLPTGIAADRVAAAGHFAVVERPLALTDVTGWAEQPCAANHHGGFVDVSDGQRGVALIAADLPEYEAIPGERGVALALTLLRSVGWLSRDDILCRPGHAGPGFPTPGAQCTGTHRFRCALAVHAADWLRGGAYRQALDHGVPPRAVMPPRHQPEPDAARKLPAELSFLTVEGAGLVLSAVKRSEDGCWLVVRVYNVAGGPVAGRLRCYRSIAEAVLLRLDEAEPTPLRPDLDGTLPFEAPGGKILTFGLRLA